MQTADELMPDDEDTNFLIEQCRRRLSLPVFNENFRQRTIHAWLEFSNEAEELAQRLRKCEEYGSTHLILGGIKRILNIALSHAPFEIGFSDDKVDLILTPSHDKMRLFALNYFVSRAPKSVLKHWNISVGQQSDVNIGMCAHDLDIRPEDVQLWLKEDDDSYHLYAYCEKLLSLQHEDRNEAYSLLSAYLDKILGEIACMRYISALDMLDEPMAGGELISLTLQKLPEKLQSLGKDIHINAQSLIETSFVSYNSEPDDSDDAPLRSDIVAGSSCALELCNGYKSKDESVINALQEDGISAGFFAFSLVL